jgi:hypothetical protein
MPKPVIFVAAILFVGSLALSTAEAVTSQTSGLRPAGDAVSAVSLAQCWRWGWHGWGWYPACAKSADACLKCQWHWGSRNCWRTC